MAFGAAIAVVLQPNAKPAKIVPANMMFSILFVLLIDGLFINVKINICLIVFCCKLTKIINTPYNFHNIFSFIELNNSI